MKKVVFFALLLAVLVGVVGFVFAPVSDAAERIGNGGSRCVEWKWLFINGRFTAECIKWVSS